MANSQKKATSKVPVIAWTPKAKETLADAVNHDGYNQVDILLHVSGPMLQVLDVLVTELMSTHVLSTPKKQVTDAQKQQAQDMAKKQGIQAANKFLKQCARQNLDAAKRAAPRKPSRSFFIHYMMWLGVLEYIKKPDAHHTGIFQRETKPIFDGIMKELERKKIAITA